MPKKLSKLEIKQIYDRFLNIKTINDLAQLTQTDTTLLYGYNEKYYTSANVKIKHKIRKLHIPQKNFKLFLQELNTLLQMAYYVVGNDSSFAYKITALEDSYTWNIKSHAALHIAKKYVLKHST